MSAMNRDKYRRNREGPLRKEINQELQQNPIICAFHVYAQELDDKHDRHERLVKLSRDVTIESKRIIFLLHTIDRRKNNAGKVLQEAKQRLNKLIQVNFKAIAKELHGQDPYQFRYAFSPGLQEFIEAYTFYEYFKHCETDGDDDDKNLSGISDWQALQSKMNYDDAPAAAEGEVNEEKEPIAGQCSKYEFFVDPNEYILGLSDLTGELMRRCINCLGSGETNVCMETCKVLQQFYTGYISLTHKRSRELSRKIFTMHQSLLKAENVCYNLKVRGGEAAKWGSMLDNQPIADHVDEGFY